MKKQLPSFFKFAENLKNVSSLIPTKKSKFLTIFLVLCGGLLNAQAPGCPNVFAGEDVELDCETNCTELTATFLDTGETTFYEVSSIPYDPPFPFTGLSNPVSVGADDVWSDQVDLPFDFSFFGINYDRVFIGSNGIISFNTQTPGGFCAFGLSAPDLIPTPNIHQNAIMLYHDIDPRFGDAEVGYEIIGEAPCRTLVVSFANVPYYNSGSNSSAISTFQMVLYETTNTIEFYVETKPDPFDHITSPINQGRAVLGIQNNGGTLGFTPPDRNTSLWEATDEAWRFSPNGSSTVDFAWLDENDEVIGTTTTIEVCPTQPETTYTARAIYNLPTGDTLIVTDEVIVTNCIFSEPDCITVDFLEDFGTGVGRFETPFTNYTFQPVGQVDDGQYVISNSTAGLNTGWYTDMTDHTGNPDGRMLVVNAAFDPGEFYRRTITLASNLDYTFRAWITTVYDTDTAICAGTGIPANVIFRIEDLDGNTIAETTTGDIINGPEPDWQEYLINFNSLENTDVQLVLVNNSIGGCGNDLAIDDISLTYSSDPPVIATPDDMIQCDITGSTSIFDLTTQILVILDGQDPADFNASFHLSEIDASTNSNPIASPESYQNTENPQTIYVRVENADQPSCYNIVQFALIVNDGIDIVTNLPETLAFCDNEASLSLDATPTNPGIDLSLVTYEWYFDGDLISQDAEITPSESGVYTVIIEYDACSQLTVNINVDIQEAPLLDLGLDENFCDGDSFEIIPVLSGNSANTTYLWSTGETTPTITVNTSNNYSLEITDGSCVVTDAITLTFGDFAQVGINDTIFSCPNETQLLTATSSISDVSYTWFKNGVQIPGETASTIEVLIDEDIVNGAIVYSVEVNSNGCISSANVEVRPYPNNAKCVISQGLSPDGSVGLNDNFDLSFLAVRTGIANLQIFNRQGRTVYEKSNYTNEWTGNSDDGNKLPTGTYYYVITFSGEDPVYGNQKTGWIYINRGAN